MKTEIYLRPLQKGDAYTSWLWRNDPDVWTYTGSKPDRYITKEIEYEWICRALSDGNSKRYAICQSDDHEHIGNIQLTDINNNKAQLHIFIGNKNYWGKGIGTLATKKILDIAFYEMLLNEVYLSVNSKNRAAISCYIKNGFLTQDEQQGLLTMSCKKDKPIKNAEQTPSHIQSK